MPLSHLRILSFLNKMRAQTIKERYPIDIAIIINYVVCKPGPSENAADGGKLASSPVLPLIYYIYYFIAGI